MKFLTLKLVTVFCMVCVLCLLVSVGCRPSLRNSSSNSSQSKTNTYTSIVSCPQVAEWGTPDGSGICLTTKHYRIFTTVTDHQMRSHFPGFMEAAYANYIEMTGLTGLAGLTTNRAADKPMPIYLMANRRQWADLTRHRLKERAGLYLQIEAGGYCYRGVCVFWRMGGLESLAVAAHEGMHQFLHYHLRGGNGGNRGNNLPMWLEEGLCTTAEGYDLLGESVRFTPGRNIIRFSDLRRSLIAGHWIPLERLLVMDGGDAVAGRDDRHPTDYYGQVWALTQFLRSQPCYAAKVRRMLAAAAAGRYHRVMNVSPEALAELQLRQRIYNRTVSEPLFRHYISNNIQAFERAYRAYAVKLAGLDD